MRLGVLDVGSNTIHLLVVDAHRGAHPWPTHSQKERLRLAEQLNGDGSLTDAGSRSLVEACTRAKEAARRFDVDELMAFATSAVRDASNSADVLRRVWLETGVDLRVLSGEDEARMTFLAVRRWFGWSAGRLLVLAIAVAALVAGGLGRRSAVRACDDAGSAGAGCRAVAAQADGYGGTGALAVGVWRGGSERAAGSGSA
jgi:exopolyphosphatase/guanosine-5'-triphosphate,3'-diphosphate pyrophosphatase